MASAYWLLCKVDASKVCVASLGQNPVGALTEAYQEVRPSKESQEKVCEFFRQRAHDQKKS